MHTITPGANTANMPANRLRPTAAPTLMEVLRTHGLGELTDLEQPKLLAYHDFLAAKIDAHRATLRTNVAKGFAAEIKQDIRYFQTIQDSIETILTARFATK